MRLIDADRLRAKITAMVTRPHQFMYEIERAPTVEAIPIEWIKRYIAEEGIYPNRELLSVELADAIERMIENWEKENGNI